MHKFLIVILTSIASLLSISSSYHFACAFIAASNPPRSKKRVWSHTLTNPPGASLLTATKIPFFDNEKKNFQKSSSNFEQKQRVLLYATTQEKPTSSTSSPSANKKGSLLLKPEKSRQVTSLIQEEEEEEIALIFFTGCAINPHQYKGLAQSIQDQSRQNVWIYIPKIPMNMANPFSTKKIMKQSLEFLEKNGFKGKHIYISGHSLGAIFLPRMLKSDHDLAKRVKGIIMLGAFMPRSHNRESSSKEYENDKKKVRTLTLNGDLDGLIRPSRVAEAFYHQIILPHRSMIQNNSNDENFLEITEKMKLHDPVIVVEGMNHFQFINGKKPMMKNLRDLPSEMSYTEACCVLGKAIGEFLDYHHHHDRNQEAKQYLLDQLTKTQEYLNPLISAMELEGSVHMGHGIKRMNHSNSLKAEEEGGPSRFIRAIIDQRNNGRSGSPWVARAHQFLMPAEKVYSTQMKTRDRSNQSWLINIFSDLSYSLPTIRQVKCENNMCDKKIVDDKTRVSSNDDRDLVLHLELGSVSQAVHEEMDIFDTGMFSNAAWELRAKFNSPQSISHALRSRGISIEKNDNESEMKNMGSKINSETIKWALDRIPDKVRRRYLEHGKQLIAGCDIEQSNGPSWIWSRLQYENVKGGDGKKYCKVNSHVLKTPVDHPIPLIGGKFYCKLLSPFKAMDWMYMDSLRG